MQPNMSARAAKIVRTKLAIPMHFATDESMTPDTKVFVAELKKLYVPFYEMKPGETILYRDKSKLVDER